MVMIILSIEKFKLLLGTVVAFTRSFLEHVRRELHNPNFPLQATGKEKGANPSLHGIESP